MENLITVVVPIYNVEAYLNKCVDSIISQTYKNLEIFLVDDGSTDKCGIICDEYAKQDNRIKVIHKKNGGLSDARNVAIEQATGKYITFIDSDDYVSSELISYLYSLICKYNARLSVCEFNYVTEDGKVLNHPLNDNSEKVMDTKESVKELLKMKLYSNSPCAKLYLAEDFKDIRYPYGKIYEDIPTTYKLFLKADKVVFGAQVHYFYLYRNNSISKQSFTPKRLDAVTFVEEMRDEILNIYPDLENVANSRTLDTYVGVLKTADKSENSEVYKDMLTKIYKIRGAVLRDKQCPKKRRLIAGLSYLPHRIFKAMLKKV